jgi:branched-chain amino acid transport system substrate-binding protein
MIKRLSVVTAAALLPVALAACGSSNNESTAASTGSASTASSSGSGQAETIKVGVLTSKSGFCPPNDGPAALGMHVTANKINQTGFKVGDKTYKLELITKDTKSDNTAGIAALNGLVHDDGVKFVLGPLCGSFVEPGLPAVATKSKVILISGVGDPALPASGPVKPQDKYVFGMQPNPVASATATAPIVNLFADADSIKKVYVLVDGPLGKPFGQALAAAYRKSGRQVTETYFDSKTQDFSGFIAKVKVAKPDLLVGGVTVPESLSILREALAQKAAPRYFGYGGDLNDALKTAVGKPIDIPAVFFSVPVSLQYPTSPAIKEFADAYQAAGGDVKANLANNGPAVSDGVYGLIEAMKRAGTTEDTDAIAKQLETVKFDAVRGNGLSFGETHALPLISTVCLADAGKVTCKPITTLPALAQG